MRAKRDGRRVFGVATACLVILTGWFGLSVVGQEIVLDPEGVSQLGWPFEEVEGWTSLHGNGPGEGSHRGDLYYTQDWNWGAANDDEGKPIHSATSGVVIHATRDASPCEVGVCGWGNQVIIQINDEFAIRYAHLKDVDVEVGDRVVLGTPIGILGHSGLSGKLPYTAHLHVSLYKDIGELSPRGRGNRTALDWLKLGVAPYRLEGGPTRFAAPFELNPEVQG
ncbi:MAG: M23 family metallopeptidase [Candidatus Bipolaricaulia bacterium]